MNLPAKFLIPLTLVAAALPLRAADAPASGEKAAATTSAVSPAAKAGLLKEEMDRVSYSLGLSFGSSIKVIPDLKVERTVAGLRDAVSGNSLLSDQERDEILNRFEKDMRARNEMEMRERIEKTKQEGGRFLAGNQKKDGVKTLPSGLQYKVLQTGEGPSPRAEDIVTIHYRGTFIDGREFDSSYARKTPATVPLNRVIRGWSEALQLMKAGAKWQLFIPWELGYGEKGAGRDVPPYAALIYEMELISIEKAPAAGAAPIRKKVD